MKTTIGFVVAFVCVVALWSGVAFAAPETGGVTGKAVDLGTGAGIADVHVVALASVEYEEDRPYARVEGTTGADGTYTLRGLLTTLGYGLFFEKVGYTTGTRVTRSVVAGKTQRISDVPLCPIPTAHGVYILGHDDVSFFQRFAAGNEARPEHMPTYAPLPQATYTKTPIEGQEGKFTRTFTLPRATVIPQILHKSERAAGEALLFLSKREEGRSSAFMKIHESTEAGSSRSFTAEAEGWNVRPVIQISLSTANGCIVYTGTSYAGQGEYYALTGGVYVALVPSEGSTIARAFLFEIVDTTTGDEPTRCRNILTIMRHEIAEFRQGNGRWPTYKELNGFTDNGRELAQCYNPFCNSGLVANADALGIKKNSTYLELRGDCPIGWLYSPSTGELWPATESGNGEAGW